MRYGRGPSRTIGFSRRDASVFGNKDKLLFLEIVRPFSVPMHDRISSHALPSTALC